MTTQTVKEDSTIPYEKVDTLREYRSELQVLFRVAVGFDSPHAASGVWWISLQGQKSDVEDAKVFIKSLCNPETESRLRVSDNHSVDLQAFARDVERETKAVVVFPSRSECSIRGSELNVAMAYSMVEQKLGDLKSGPRGPAISQRSPRRDIDPALKDFAIKLGYTEQDINQVVRKLGADVDQNTLLHELIKISTSSPMQLSAQSRPQAEEFRGYGPTSVPNRRDRSPHTVVSRNNASTSRRNPASAPQMGAVDLYNSDRTAVYARGARPKQAPVAWQPQNGGPQNGHDKKASAENQGLRERHEDDKMYQQLLNTKDEPSPGNKSDLRPIVVDGSNVAMSHGHQDVFSCKGIKLCVEYFKKRGHKEIYVFVPQWRKETPRQEHPMTDQEILFSLEREGRVFFTPSRKLENGRRIVCYDDRFIVKLAAENGGIIVSNDNYRDLCNENPQWKEVIEHRLLMYSFVGDIFMVPDDPLGRHGPTLDDFMRKGTITQPRICPYLKRCTYGLRCRFYHPERDTQVVQGSTQSNQPKVETTIPLRSSSDAASKKIAMLREMFPEAQLEPTIRKLVVQNPHRGDDWLVDRMLERE